MTVLIDSRLGSRKLIKHSPLSDLGVLCRLESGDASMAGNGPDGPLSIGIEVKSIFDMVASLATGRLQAQHDGQLRELADAYDLCFLLYYYGNCRVNLATGMLQTKRRRKDARGRKYGSAVWTDYAIGRRVVPYGYVEGFLASPSFLQFGVVAHRVTDIAEAAFWIGVLYRCWSRPWASHKSTRVFNRAHDVAPATDFTGGERGKQRQDALRVSGVDEKTLHHRACFAKEFPSLGYERAIAAAAQVGTVRQMANATQAQWAAVEVTSAKGRTARLGNVVAKAIIEAVNR